MNILIRTDASEQIGSGHVMRCLTIAEQLRTRSCSVSFYMEDLRGNLIDYVKQNGFEVVDYFYPVDICIVDHYELDIEWEQSIRPYVDRIIVIDDLANRKHDCDILLDQNVVANYKTRYENLVPAHCTTLLGAGNLILRDEFIRERNKLRDRDGNVERLLIFMGGTDPTGETKKVLKALANDNNTFNIVDVVVGNGNSQKDDIEKRCQSEGWNFYCQIDYIASLMQKADFSIGAGGSTTWERCFLGLPSTSTIVAENQIEATKEAEKLRVVWNLGWHEQVNIETYSKLLDSLSSKQKELQIMTENGLKLTETSHQSNEWIDIFLEGLT